MLTKEYGERRNFKLASRSGSVHRRDFEFLRLGRLALDMQILLNISSPPSAILTQNGKHAIY